MAKKKKKKQRPKQRSSSGAGRASSKGATGQGSPQARVFKHMAVLLIAFALCFYVVLQYSIGGAAYWKAVLLMLAPFLYLAARKQFFQAPPMAKHLRLSAFRVLTGVAVFVLTNGICYLLLKFALLGKQTGEPSASVAGVLIFLLSPMFAFSMKANFVDLGPLITVGIFSLVYTYGLVTLGHFEFHHGVRR